MTKRVNTAKMLKEKSAWISSVMKKMEQNNEDFIEPVEIDEEPTLEIEETEDVVFDDQEFDIEDGGIEISEEEQLKEETQLLLLGKWRTVESAGDDAVEKIQALFDTETGNELKAGEIHHYFDFNQHSCIRESFVALYKDNSDEPEIRLQRKECAFYHVLSDNEIEFHTHLGWIVQSQDGDIQSFKELSFNQEMQFLYIRKNSRQKIQINIEPDTEYILEKIDQ